MYSSKYLKDLFLKEDFYELVVNEIMPWMIAFQSVVKYRQFLDFKDSKLFMNTIKPKYSPDHVLEEQTEDEDS
jgi:hypothetical protein